MNKIEIGQFLNMKNNAGIKNSRVESIIIANGSDTEVLSIIKPANTVSITVKTITPPNGAGKSFFRSNSLPSAVKNFSFLNVVPLKNLTSVGTSKRVVQNITTAATDLLSAMFMHSAVLKPALIPAAKKSVQKRSPAQDFLELGLLVLGIVGLFCFVKSCIFMLFGLAYNLWFKTYSNIISNIHFLKKIIINILLVCTMSLCGGYAVATDFQEYSNTEISELILTAEKSEGIPSGLLAAIAKVESGVHKFAINLNGKSVFAASKEDALLQINKALDSGLTNIDIGVMQLNWRWHHWEFVDAEEMLEPASNIKYAASLLRSLYNKHGDWQSAVRYYHSATGIHHRKYSRKVVMCWLDM